MPNVVLFQPQIPPNTGNVARTCVATGSELHLIEPLGFQIDDKQLRRAGLDYWPFVQLHRHADHTHFLQQQRAEGGRLVALSARVQDPYTSFRFRSSDWLLFGCESDGLPAELLALADHCLTIPMPCQANGGAGGVRSLNLSVAVGVVLFEALRQLNDPGPPQPGSSSSVA
jgi:tRNA (cytidine/uridine-2'-O-)-methyltransferase